MAEKEVIAPLGRIGCDSPAALVKMMFQLFKEINEDDPVDLIIVPGDLVSHNISLFPDEPRNKTADDAKYVLLKDTHSKV